ncbi:restriction endonuclease subunit S [Marinobacter shengliensis]|uniref:restriction endonuclease subunit S n=1 Tax=Marinobacter shengliensis TaxID=1389223 RepID=UPI0025726A50|nr:restriction endonuclease subunit S [Marinobacter shengliensis]BEH13875.1 type I restriction system specificity protein [Marinobacter shengliensis]
MSSVSFIDKLLDGVEVEWKALGDVAQYSSTRVDADIIDSTSFVGVDNLVANKGGRMDANYLPNTSRITAYEPGDILLGNIRPYLKKVWRATNSGGCSGDVLAIRILDAHKQVIDSNFLYYLLSSDAFFSYNMQHVKGAKMPRGNKAAILNYLIPIPCPENHIKSLEIQAEIVRILDAFTSLTAELTAELTARKKQYNYYRDKLLSFEDGEVAWKPLGEIGEFIRGKRFTKADYVDDGISAIHYGEIYTRYGAFTTQAHSQVRSDMAKTLRYAQPGDVVITDVGETVEDVGKAVAWLGDGKVAIHDHCYAFRHTMNPKYISYCMQTASFIAEKAKHVARTKVNTLLMTGFSKVSIPIPYPDDLEKSLDEQARIVSILDKFNALTDSISEGLPREIELRQKQYEYYRDLLLSFPKPEEVVA